MSPDCIPDFGPSTYVAILTTTIFSSLVLGLFGKIHLLTAELDAGSEKKGGFGLPPDKGEALIAYSNFGLPLLLESLERFEGDEVAEEFLLSGSSFMAENGLIEPAKN